MDFPPLQPCPVPLSPPPAPYGPVPVKRGPGRPKGSANKPKPDAAAGGKNLGGRPAGVPNRKRLVWSAAEQKLFEHLGR